MMVEKLERLLFSKACVPPPLEQQGDTTPCEQERFTLPWKHQGHRIMDISDYAESKAFMSMVIKSAWLVLNLAFSFEPIAEVVRVSMRIVFNVDYMEDMMCFSQRRDMVVAMSTMAMMMIMMMEEDVDMANCLVLLSGSGTSKSSNTVVCRSVDARASQGTKRRGRR